MPSPIRRSILLAALVLLGGCAGVNFTRPDPRVLQVGVSTEGDVVYAMGLPQQVGELQRNGRELKTLQYSYSQPGGEGLHPGVLPARQMTFSLSEGTLVGQEFVSSFRSDGTDFDATRLSAITLGSSTRTDVVGLLGRPNGEAIFPLARRPGQRALIYSYAQTRGTVFHFETSRKVLVVTVGPDDVVVDVQYTAGGEP